MGNLSRRGLYWLFQLVGWGLFAATQTFFAIIFDRLDKYFLFKVVIYIVLGLLLTSLMRIAILRLNLLLKPIKQQIYHFLLITIVFTLINAYTETLLYHYLRSLPNEFFSRLWPKNPVTGDALEFHKFFFNNCFYSFIFFFIWNSIYFMYHYITKSQKQQLDTLRLESLIKELELKTIKAHINPHFIFNSLNSIRALIDENPGRARRAITELSNILRSSMQTEKVELVPFEKELGIVKDYLALENMRFEDRLKVEYEIDEDTLEQPVPPMMLQTLVENAIKHGISRRVDGGLVKIISDFRENYHELAVQNTGKLNGFDMQEGFGLSSTQNRIHLLYGEKAKFEIKQLTPGLVEAKVMIPVIS